MLKVDIDEDVRKKFNNAVMAKHGCLTETIDGKKVGHLKEEVEIALSDRTDKINEELRRSKTTPLDLESAAHRGPLGK
jgi:hypothetical protein